MLDFYAHNRQDLERYCQELGLPQVHAKTLMRVAYKKLVTAPWEARERSFPLQLVRKMSQDFCVTSAKVVSEHLSRYDGSVKFLIELHDKRQIESVLMPEKNRLTLCVSSQVGCAQACAFCHTGRMGLLRNLTAGEIVSQVRLANQWVHEHPEWLPQNHLPMGQRVSNLVFMGMGEPLDNCDALIKAVRILLDPMGFHLGESKIGVSTAGHLDGLKNFRAVFPNIPIALSLHATTDFERNRIMPINRRFSLSDLMIAVDDITRSSKRSVLIQYTLIDGVNDRLEDAQNLARLLNGRRVKINLIPFNEIMPSRFRSPKEEAVRAFKDYLHAQGFRVMIRYSNGQDIQAACGQLVSQA